MRFSNACVGMGALLAFWFCCCLQGAHWLVMISAAITPNLHPLSSIFLPLFLFFFSSSQCFFLNVPQTKHLYSWAPHTHVTSCIDLSLQWTGIAHDCLEHLAGTYHLMPCIFRVQQLGAVQVTSTHLGIVALFIRLFWVHSLIVLKEHRTGLLTLA